MSNRVRIVERRRATFTLIELLVVVAIVAVLAAILLPALSRAQAQAYQVRCAANLKNFGLGIFYYVHDRSNATGIWRCSAVKWRCTPGRTGPIRSSSMSK